jgi:hypothetical protein
MLRKLNAAKIVFCATLLLSSVAYAQSASDLTSSERAEIWRSLGGNAMRTSIPAGLHVGEQVPDTMRLLPFDRRLRNQVPAIKSCSYALLQGQVLIIDRRTRVIVSIVSE